LEENKNILKMIYTMQFIVYKSEFPFADNSYTFIDEKTGSPKNKIEEYVELVHDEHSNHVGWFLHIIALDPLLNLNKLFDDYFDWMFKSKSTKGKGGKNSKLKELTEPNSTLTPKFILIESKKEWIEKYLNSYLEDRYNNYEYLSEATAAQTLPFMNENNKARPSFIFNHEKLHEKLSLVVKTLPELISVNSDTKREVGCGDEEAEEEKDDNEEEAIEVEPGEEEEGEEYFAKKIGFVKHNKNQYKLTFKNGAYYIPHSSRDPSQFFNLDLINEPSLENGKPIDESRKKNKYKKTGDVIEDARNEIKAIFDEAKSVEELNALRSCDRVMNILKTVLRCDEKNNGGQLLNNWLFEQMIENPNWSPSTDIISDENNIQFDEKLSDFGNCIARDLYHIESACGIAVFHVELFIVETMTVYMYNVEYRGLRFNIVFSGGQGIGKSHIMRLVEDLSVKGLVVEMGEVSKLAHTSSEPNNGRLIYIDEVGGNYSGGGTDGTGDSAMKSILSNGDIVTQHLHIDKETGKRLLVTTLTEARSCVSGSTNLDKFQADAMQDRFYFRFILSCLRKEKNKDLEKGEGYTNFW